MKENEVVHKLKRIRDELNRAMLLIPLYERGEKKDELTDSLNRVCSLLFKNKFYPEIWDEGILLKLERLFQTISPNKSQWGEHLQRIGEQTRLVKQVNDFFFSVINKDSSIDEILGYLSLLTDISETVAAELRSVQQLSQIRGANVASHKKIKSLVNYLTNDLSLDFGEKGEGIRAVIAWLEGRESSEGPNALLVHDGYGIGAVVPLQIQLQDGNGDIRCLVPGCKHFEKAIERAKVALVAVNLIRQTRDVTFSLNITEARYLGDSIALPAAMGMYSKEQGIPSTLTQLSAGTLTLRAKNLGSRQSKDFMQSLKQLVLPGAGGYLSRKKITRK